MKASPNGALPLPGPSVPRFPDHREPDVSGLFHHHPGVSDAVRYQRDRQPRGRYPAPDSGQPVLRHGHPHGVYPQSARGFGGIRLSGGLQRLPGVLQGDSAGLPAGLRHGGHFLLPLVVQRSVHSAFFPAQSGEMDHHPLPQRGQQPVRHRLRHDVRGGDVDFRAGDDRLCLPAEEHHQGPDRRRHQGIKKEEAGRLPLLYEGRHPAVPMPKTPLKKEARGLPFFRYSMLMK